MLGADHPRSVLMPNILRERGCNQTARTMRDASSTIYGAITDKPEWGPDGAGNTPLSPCALSILRKGGCVAPERQKRAGKFLALLGRTVPALFADDVDNGAPLKVRLGLPEYVMSDRSDIPLAQRDIAEHVHERPTLRPIEVAVHLFAVRVAQVQKEGGDGIRYRRTLGAQHPVAANLYPPYLKHVLEL